MAMELPFLRCVEHIDPRHPDFTSYWMVPVRGPRVRAVRTHRGADGRIFYVAVTRFRQRYQGLLGLGHNLIWMSKFELDKWLEAVVHNSFVRCSRPGVLRCWYKKTISHADMHGPMVLPVGCAQDFNIVGRIGWILVKHGLWSWPIRVVNGRLQNGWAHFRDAHAFEVGYKLLLICERQWVFTAIILGHDGGQVWPDWAEMVNQYRRTLYAPEGLVRTALSVSEVEEEYPLSNSGYSHVAGIDDQEEFEQRIQMLFHDVDVGYVVIRMNHRVWLVPFEGNHLDAGAFAEFIAELDLGEDDYIFVSISAAREVRVVVLDALEGAERLYPWV